MKALFAFLCMAAAVLVNLIYIKMYAKNTAKVARIQKVESKHSSLIIFDHSVVQYRHKAVLSAALTAHLLSKLRGIMLLRLGHRLQRQSTTLVDVRQGHPRFPVDQTTNKVVTLVDFFDPVEKLLPFLVIQII